MGRVHWWSKLIYDWRQVLTGDRWKRLTVHLIRLMKLLLHSLFELILKEQSTSYIFNVIIFNLRVFPGFTLVSISWFECLISIALAENVSNTIPCLRTLPSTPSMVTTKWSLHIVSDYFLFRNCVDNGVQLSVRTKRCNCSRNIYRSIRIVCSGDYGPYIHTRRTAQWHYTCT